MFTLRRSILIFILQFTTTQMYSHFKPLAKKIWSEQCMKNSVVLNDCNWCRCNSKQKYDCKARVCEEIDMFGHFKDAIQEIDVGMEGHGAWRSRPLACTPGVHYRRGAVMCVCDEDGNWPNPVCRDLFQILHSVEMTGQTRLSKNDSCSPTKLYLVGCNVCFCPSSGYLDPQMCTTKECQEDDPVIEANETLMPSKHRKEIEEDLEIYAMCDPKFKYELGCRNCDCLRNNRLLCGNCSLSNSVSSKESLKNSAMIQNKLTRASKIKHSGTRKQSDSICTGKKPFEVFKVGCNLCHCDKQFKMFCTVKKCIDNIEKLRSSFNIDNRKWSVTEFKVAAEPPDDESCVPGTVFKRDCNTCRCGRVINGIKQFICTRIMCGELSDSKKGAHSKVIDRQKKDCVPGTFYREHCMICYCFVKDKVKYQMCQINIECDIDSHVEFMDNTKFQGAIQDDVTVNSLHGFCEPMRRYTNDCNFCRCLSDGKTVECTSKICLRPDDLSVDIVPVIIENSQVCPKGHSYKLDCNLCFCLSNGNAICTTFDCSKQNKFIL